MNRKAGMCSLQDERERKEMSAVLKEKPSQIFRKIFWRKRRPEGCHDFFAVEEEGNSVLPRVVERNIRPTEYAGEEILSGIISLLSDDYIQYKQVTMETQCGRTLANVEIVHPQAIKGPATKHTLQYALRIKSDQYEGWVATTKLVDKSGQENPLVITRITVRFKSVL